MCRVKSQVGAAVAVLALSSTLRAPSSPASATDRPAAPRAFAANGRIAFTEPDPREPTYAAAPQVWTAAADGSGAQRAFAAIDEYNAYPEWSPDGRWIAFYRGHTLMVARADGSEARIVAPGAGIIGAVTSWSPDGTRIAYSVGSNPVRGRDLGRQRRRHRRAPHPQRVRRRGSVLVAGRHHDRVRAEAAGRRLGEHELPRPGGLPHGRRRRERPPDHR
jgi:hypothetical protein